MKTTFFALVLAFVFFPFSSAAAADTQSRFMQQCLASGDAEDSCMEREEDMRKDMPKLRKEKRMQFVQMIIEAKRYCRSEHADKEHVRLCFRVAVKEGVLEQIRAMRELKKECRAEGAVGYEITYCALFEYLDMDEEEEENNEEENENNEDEEEESGENEEENENEEEENGEEENNEEEGNNEEEELESTLQLEYEYDDENNITFTWETENVDSCTAESSPEQSDWSGDKDTSGTQIVSDVQEVTDFTLTCDSSIEGGGEISVSEEIDTNE